MVERIPTTRITQLEIQQRYRYYCCCCCLLLLHCPIDASYPIHSLLDWMHVGSMYIMSSQNRRHLSQPPMADANKNGRPPSLPSMTDYYVIQHEIEGHIQRIWSWDSTYSRSDPFNNFLWRRLVTEVCAILYKRYLSYKCRMAEGSYYKTHCGNAYRRVHPKRRAGREHISVRDAMS
jgi:hypothetical protein